MRFGASTGRPGNTGENATLAFLNQLSLLTKDRFVLGTALVPLHPENPINLQGLHFGVSYEGRVKITAHGHVLIEMV
jgi:hypothetical protein